MKTLAIVLTLLAGSLTALPASAATMYINATQDAMADKFEPDRYPFNTYLLWVRGTHFFTQQRFAVQFEQLDQAPPVAQIDRASLQLRLHGGHGVGRARVRVTPAEDNWSVENFPQRGPGINLNAPYVEAVISGSDDSDRWLTFDFTDTIKDWLIHGGGSRGFSVSAQPADLSNRDTDPSQFFETQYAVAFESTDSLHPEYSEQFGFDFPPGHPPRLKIQYRPTAFINPSQSTETLTKPTPLPSKNSKKQVKGISDSNVWNTLQQTFRRLLPSF